MIFSSHAEVDEDKTIFVFGDIHGAYHLLEQAKFDLGITEEDIKVYLGDLTDRGKQNFKCVMEVMRKPNSFCIRGNHEDMMIRGMLNGDRRYYECWFHNGGETVLDELGEEGATALAVILDEAPVILTLNRGEDKYAFVHAEYPAIFAERTIEWVVEWVGSNKVRAERTGEMLMWERDIITCINEGLTVKPVLGVDAIFHGHTPVKKAFSHGNRHYIDTGGVFNENLTVAVLEPGKDVWYYSTLTGM